VDLLEKCLVGVFNFVWFLIGLFINWAGDKITEKVPDAPRPMDTIKTNRRMSKDQKELYNEYVKLRKYSDTAEDTATRVCGDVVISVLNPPVDELDNPFVKSAGKLCLDILRFEGYFPLPEIDFSKQYSLGETWDFTKKAFAPVS
jgi:hypothetical protein